MWQLAGCPMEGPEQPVTLPTVGGMQVSFYALPMLALSLLIGVAAVIAVCRANKDDLPALIRALMGRGHDDGGRTPSSLPKPSDDDEPTPPSPSKP
jgi:hypothetical protein